jgi:hypothetical protein
MTKGASFAQQYLIQKGPSQEGWNASMKEMDQLHCQDCFTPISIADMSPIERRRAQQALMFLTEKRDKSIKGRMFFNGKPTREWLSREDSASPMAALESIMLTALIDATERHDIMTCNIPNAFIQAGMPEVEPGDERVMMKISGVLVDMLVEINTQLYGPHVVYEKRGKVIYVQVLWAIYGMLELALLQYKLFCGGLEKTGFKFNSYDPCTANQPQKGSQQTIIFHVDNLKSSHKDSRVNDQFDKWLQKNYREHEKNTTHRGKIHEYLGMQLDYTKDRKVKIGMIKYVENMLKEFPIKFKSTDKATLPRLFNRGQGKKLEIEWAEAYHTMVAKGLFLGKHTRPEIQPTIAVMCTRVKDPNEADWSKLVRMMKHLNSTTKLRLILSAENLHCIKWYVDASFAVHPDFKSQTGAAMHFEDGVGAVQSVSRKLTLNTRSSTESELFVGANNISVIILWTKLFM